MLIFIYKITGELSVTISQVVPVVLDIHSNLRKWMDDARFCRPMVVALHSSMQKRFRGIFSNCGMMAAEATDGNQIVPFCEKIYFIAAVLDPTYMLDWVDVDVVVDENVEAARGTLKETMKGTCMLVL